MRVYPSERLSRLSCNIIADECELDINGRIAQVKSSRSRALAGDVADPLVAAQTDERNDPLEALIDPRAQEHDRQRPSFVPRRASR